MDSRPRPLPDISTLRPVNVSARGYYNFFTPDERVSESTSIYQGAFTETRTERNSAGFNQEYKYFRDHQGNLTREENIRGIVPRYVLVNFTAPPNVERNVEGDYDRLEDLHERGLINFPDRTVSAFDIQWRSLDLSLSQRLKSKFDLAVRMATRGATDGFSEEAINKTANGQLPGLTPEEGYSYPLTSDEINVIRNLINQNLVSTVENVNELGAVYNVNQKVNNAQFTSMEGTVDRRYYKDSLNTLLGKSEFTNVIQETFPENDQENIRNLPSQTDARLFDFTINALIYDVPDGQVPQTKICLVGFVIERFEAAETIIGKDPESIYFVTSPDASSFVDVAVKYGKFYAYTVRAVFQLKKSQRNRHTGEPVQVETYIASSASDLVEARVIESKPPKAPDGLMFKFNYNMRQGLMMTWQLPVGTQRDVKYYQIFRRKSINQPFTCIGMLDFDNSEVKSPMRENVRLDKIIKLDRHTTNFEDLDFKKSSEFIYAVAAVDAHGFTSGYSAQIKVRFITSENRLDLTTVSAEGAPKQYPNWFVDPDEDRNTFINSLTQDSIKTSGFNKLRIYFDPDAMTYVRPQNAIERAASGVRFPEHVFPRPGGTLSGRSGFLPEPVSTPPDPERVERVFYTTGSDSPNGVYKLLMINTDRQKTKILEIKIEDARGSGFFR